MAILRKTKTFEELKKKVKEQSQGSSFVNKDEIKWEPNNTYRFRLLMREEDKNSEWNWHEDLNTSDGFIKKIFHGAKAKDGKYLQVICPVTFYGNKGYDMCPTCKSLPSMWEDKKCINPIYNDVKRKDGIYTHVYVIKDPVNPANEGHIKQMWMPKKVYTDLKLQIWGVDERYAKDGEELEEVDTSDAYEQEAFAVEDGFDLIVKIIKDKIKDPKTNKMRDINVYNCSFAKDRSSLDVEDFKQLEKEMEDLKLGADFIPENPDKLEEFYNHCVLGNTKPSTKVNTKEDEDEDSSDDTDDIIEEMEEMEEMEAEETVEEPTVKPAKKPAKKTEKKPAKKTEKKAEEDPDEIDMGDAEEPVDESTDEVEEVEDLEDMDMDIDIDDIMRDMDMGEDEDEEV